MTTAAFTPPGTPKEVTAPGRSLAPHAADRYVPPSDLSHGIVQLATGVRLHYVVTGEGDPVLLIPGYPQSWYAWRYVMPLLAAQGRKVFAIDPRGFGDSDMPADGYDMDTAADDLHTVIGSLSLAGETGIDIVSHDVGTWIAHAYAAKYSEDVRRLVLTDAHIPGVSPLPTDVYPDDRAVQRRWHFYFNRVQGLPEVLIQGREREYLAWFFGPEKVTRTWTIDQDAFEEYLRVFLQARSSPRRAHVLPGDLQRSRPRGQCRQGQANARYAHPHRWRRVR